MNQPIDPALRLQASQDALTSSQEQEARRFAAERITAQLSTEPVDELEAEALLRQAYEAAGLSPPTRIRWVDGPLQLAHLVATLSLQAGRDSVWENMWARFASMADDVQTRTERMAGAAHARVEQEVEKTVEARVRNRVWACVETNVLNSVEEGVWASMQASTLGSVNDTVWASVRSYEVAPVLAYCRFFDAYFAPNELRALAHFNELVAGYWLGREGAIIVRRPRVLARDEEGRLHSAIGKCIEYHDGWGFYAWHGTHVPARVSLAPETLTRDDFLGAWNLDARRIIQERMGDRFMVEMGGQVIDASPQGALYEVALLDDPEGVARYVHLENVAVPRAHFFRVPPAIQTVDEAVAWSLQLTAEPYRPMRET